jgi:signal transduction histidine kinase
MGNLLEVLVAAILIRRISRRGSPLGELSRLVGMFACFAAAVAISATIGSLSLLAGGVIDLHALPLVWRTWWLGDYGGALVVVPLAIAWYRRLPTTIAWSRVVEATALFVVGVWLAQFALSSSTPLLYLVFPTLIWAATRFGQRGATLGILIAAGIAVWYTAHHGGTFHFKSVTHSVLSAQLFIIVTGISTLCLTALLTERERLVANLHNSRSRLLEASDTERRRLEQNLHDGAQQQLIGLAYRLHEAAEHRPQDPGQTTRLVTAETELREAIDELREIAHGIHPSVLTDLGLAHAVRSAALRSALPVTFVALPEARVDANAETAAYYIFTEALANAQKHASATSIKVHIAVFGQSLLVRVSDDGGGGAHEEGGSGLTGLRDRVEALGGSFQVESSPARGTVVRATIPRK